MEDILDQLPTNQATGNVKYGGFWSRFGALFLDGLILAPITFGLTYMNVSSWKSTMLMILISIVGIGYKPFMEFTYGATWGKMALKLKVTNANFGKADLTEILFRNIFHILPQLIVLLVSISTVYNDPDFESVSGWTDYAGFLEKFAVLKYINYTSGLITIAEAIMVATDDQKRSLHDRIAKTFVIEQP
jgi:uncharacterized RDD family membrane protein YckC